MKLALSLLAALALPWLSSEEKPWAEILGASRAKPPAPASEVKWRDDVRAALAEARATDRPLLVTLRCLPCKQCAGFDAAVLEGEGELEDVLAQFITVRITSASDLDLRLFPVEGWQDLDLSWWGWILSPEGRIYSIFGGKDHVSDTTRISPEAFANTLRRVLEHHYDPRRDAWDVDGPAPELGGKSPTPLDLPGAESWKKLGAPSLKKDGCLHCHQVNEVLRQPALDAGKFDKRRDLQPWPLPENIGLSVDRDDGLRVTKVSAGSAAERAGLRVGDRLAAAGERKLFGQADLRGVLHRAPADAATIELRWWRGSELQRGQLELASGWRATELAWRKSIADGNIGAVPGFAWPMAAKPELRRKLAIPAGKMAVTPWFGKEPKTWPAWSAGLRDDDVIVAVGGESPDLAVRDFMAWFRLRYDPGDEVVLRVRDGRGREREVRYKAPAPGKQ
jgi:hypothetical protein